MKMTPEKKAWFEYGKAVANLSFARDFLRLNSWELEKYEDTVSRKEEVCRAWNPPDGRDCPNCFYSSNRRCKLPCSQCWGHCLWEPRKEGE